MHPTLRTRGLDAQSVRNGSESSVSGEQHSRVDGSVNQGLDGRKVAPQNESTLKQGFVQRTAKTDR